MPQVKSKSAIEGLKENEKKWGKPLIDAGWSLIPATIIERQQALGLDALDMNIILHIVNHWWKADSKPFPSKTKIANAVGVTARTVQRRIAEMEKGGLIRREERRIPNTGSKTNIYHLDGLIKGATPYAQEVLEDRAKTEAKRTERARKKGRPKLTVISGDE